MWNKTVDFFTAPIFLDDEEKTLRARALHALYINMGGAVALLGTLGELFVFHEKRVSSLILIIAFLMLSIEMAINKRGYVKASGILMLGVLWLMTVLMTIISGGVRSLDIIFFVSGTVIAGIVFGSTGAFFYAGLSVLTSLGLILAGNAGMQFPQIFSFPPISALIVLCMNLVFTVVPLQVALQSLSKSALRARSNEERYRLIASVMSDYVFSIRYAPDGSITNQWISGAFEKITGYTVEEYIAHGGWTSIIHSDDSEQDARDMAQVRANQKVVTEIRLVRKDGEVRWVRSYSHPVWDEKHNQLVGNFGAVQDITASKQVENELVQREAILEIAADAASLFLKVPNWTVDIWHTEVDKLLERLGTTIKASHAYIFENHLVEDSSVIMTMKYEWTAPGFVSDLDDLMYKNMPAKTGYLENWNNTIALGDPYIGDMKHVVREDMEDLASRGIYALLDVPIYIDSTWWGTIGFDDMARAREWSNAEVGALIVAANLLGATIKRQQVDATLQDDLQQRKNLIGELEANNSESETLRESVAIVAATLERSEAVQRILEQLKRVVAYDSASVWLYKDDKAVMVGWNDLPDEAVAPGEYVLSDIEPDDAFWSENAPYILLNDIQENYPVFRGPTLNYIHGWLAIPLRARGELTGFISLDSRIPGKFTEHDAKLALTFADQVSIALENARLYTELQAELFERQKLIVELVAKNAESETLRESVAIVAATLEKSEAIDRILEQLERVIPFNSASVQLVNGDALEIVSSRGFEINKEYKFILNEREPAYPVVQGLAPYILYDDIQVSVPTFNEIPHNNIRAWIAVPLKVKGKIMGIIALDGRNAGQFSERDAQLALTYANQVAIALENARLFTELQAELSERQKLIDELEFKNAELERFTYTVSHDLRSPLVTIKGFLGYMEKSASQGNMEGFRKDMQRVSSAADRMDNLLRDVLELSRIGRLINTPQEMPLEDLIREALEIIHGRIDQRGITIQIQLGLPVVYGDKTRLTEVLQNLLDNAAKYMGDQKKPIIEIGMDGYDESGNPIFFVRDNGMGIDPQYNERIFGMFDKLDPASEGTGIGLALVKRIIEVHGGRIWLESEAGKGSTFFFTLPRGD